MHDPRPSLRSLAGRARDASAALAERVGRLPPLVVPSIVFVVAIGVLVSRRPDAFLNPQFYAEDGTLWFARAYNLGPFTSMLVPDAGYLQVLATGTGAIAVLFPVSVAPLVFALGAAIIEVSPAVFLSTRRASQLIPNLAPRLALAFFYLALPNVWTNSVVMTYASWRLGLLAFLLLVTRPRSRFGSLFDGVVVALCGLGGPLILFMLPVVIVHAVVRPAARSVPILTAAAFTSAVQLWHLAGSAGARPTLPLGASVENFCRIFANQYVYSLMWGRSGFSDRVASWPWLENPAALAVVTAVGLCLLGFAAVRGPYALRLFLLFAGIVLGATLASATVTGPTQWESLGHPGAGTRYFLYGMLAIVTALGWLATCKPAAARVIGVSTLGLILLIGVRADWRHHALPDHDYRSFARDFENAPSGTVLETPIEPPGWTVILVKR
ncbi:MAG: hypothetical protein IPF53_17885 [Blastocatellia bacterium]|nr:hypothetical protein [Blastocatellia bacterium]